jgi:hypothetical protein
MPYQNVTFIDDLPEMEELQNNYTSGAIRNQQAIPHMVQDPRMKARMMQDMRHQMFGPPNMPPHMMHAQQQYPPQSYGPPQYTPPQPYTPEEEKADDTSQAASCLELAQHAQNCPLCSKVYDNDKTVYIVTIIVLAIICILLLKKCLSL